MLFTEPDRVGDLPEAEQIAWAAGQDVLAPPMPLRTFLVGSIAPLVRTCVCLDGPDASVGTGWGRSGRPRAAPVSRAPRCWWRCSGPPR
ncbi:MAG TPA: hypothetical protein VGC67_13735 [Cellulomonas sp.]